MNSGIILGVDVNGIDIEALHRGVKKEVNHERLYEYEIMKSTMLFYDTTPRLIIRSSHLSKHNI
jgi:hypothetical protein